MCVENVHHLCSGHLSFALANTMTTRNPGREENISFYRLHYTTLHHKEAGQELKEEACRQGQEQKPRELLYWIPLHYLLSLLYYTALDFPSQDETAHSEKVIPTSIGN